MSQATGSTYRLELEKDGLGESRAIEFNASGAYTALSLAREHCGRRTAAIYQDGQRLADVSLTGQVWHIGRSEKA